MNKIQLEEILDFRKVVSMINRELHSKGIFDLEYMLINNSIDDVMRVLNDNSDYYNFIKNDRYSNGATFQELIELYFQYVKQKYDSLLIPDGKNGRTADRYYNKLKEPVQNNGIYIQHPKSSIGMILKDVENTLMLMREAFLAYYKVYYNKTLIAELTTNSTNNSNYLEFTINENHLLHLLGVTANQLRENPDFIRLTGRRNMGPIEILEWIVKDLEGDKDLIQYIEESLKKGNDEPMSYNVDFLKRTSDNNFQLSRNQFSNNTQSRLLNFHKIRTKSQAFLKYGPFEKVSLVAKLQNGKRLTVNSNSNTAMISRAECFRKYPWAYFGSVQQGKDKYIETLIIDSAEGKKELFKGSTPAIVKRIDRLGEEGGGTGGRGSHIFSEEQQFDLFCMAYESFQDTMDFKNLKEYFEQLIQKKDFLTPNNNKRK